jgi:hypothetical protein
LDLHQLELRYRDLRIHDGEQRRRLIGSVAEIGQQVPVVVIHDADRPVLIDGYLRVEALHRLHRAPQEAPMPYALGRASWTGPATAAAPPSVRDRARAQRQRASAQRVTIGAGDCHMHHSRATAPGTLMPRSAPDQSAR